MSMDAGPAPLYVVAADELGAQNVKDSFRKANESKTQGMVQDGSVTGDLSRAWESARQRGVQVFDVSGGGSIRKAPEGTEFDNRSPQYRQVVLHIRSLPDTTLVAAFRDDHLTGPDFRTIKSFVDGLGGGISNPLAVHLRVAEEARGRGLITYKEFGRRVL